jgi:hypothetical protein
MNWNFKSTKKYLLILFSIFLFVIIGILITYFANKPIESFSSRMLRNFYLKNRNESIKIFELTKKFQNLSQRVIYIPIYDTVLYSKKGDSIFKKEFHSGFTTPRIVVYEKERTQWEGLYFLIQQKKVLIDQDLIKSINDLFMFYNQMSTVNKLWQVRTSYPMKIGEDQKIIGRWLTLNDILKVKLDRRIKLL